MTKTFLGKHLDKTGAEVLVYFSDRVTQSPALGLLFKTNSYLLDSNLSPSVYYWDKLDSCQVVWAEDDKENVLSGIVFNFFAPWSASALLTAFSDPATRYRGISKICFSYYLEKSIESGATRTLSMTSVNNTDVIKSKDGEPVSYSGPRPTFIVFIDKI
jgi:hypothetical protein